MKNKLMTALKLPKAAKFQAVRGQTRMEAAHKPKLHKIHKGKKLK